MAIDATKVLVGAPDQQATTGAIRTIDVIQTSAIPANFDAAETLLATMTPSGYVSEDGLELANDMSTTDIREWGRNIVRKILDTFDNTLSWSLIQMDAASWKQALGDDFVTETAATTTHGAQLHIEMGAHLAPEKTWAFAMKDGDTKIIIIVPRGQITALDTITFNASEAIALPLTLSCYDGGDGETLHIYIDDGQKTS